MSKSGKIFWIAIAVAVVLMIVVAASHNSPVDAAKAQTQAGTQTDSATAEQNARFQLAFGGALTLRRAVRDPGSFEVSSAIVTMKDRAVCYEFRSRNGFGGMDNEMAVLGDEQFLMEGQSGFLPSWNKNCREQSGHQLARDVMMGLRQYDQRRGY